LIQVNCGDNRAGMMPPVLPQGKQGFARNLIVSLLGLGGASVPPFFAYLFVFNDAMYPASPFGAALFFQGLLLHLT
jgi:hypothetical protein